MQITLNGESHDLAEGATVTTLLDRLGVATRGVAVEVNRKLVPRQRHAEWVLEPGDCLEVVTLVGGG